MSKNLIPCALEDLVKITEVENILKANWDLSILVSRAELKLNEYFGVTPLYLETVEENKFLMSVFILKFAQLFQCAMSETVRPLSLAAAESPHLSEV